MKRFKDLELTGSDEHLLAVVSELTDNLPPGWHRDGDAEARLEGVANQGRDAGFAFAREAREGDPPAGLFLAREPGRLWVSNIVPRETGELSYDQYNTILDEFAGLLGGHVPDGGSVTLHATSDQADIAEWVSPRAVELLSNFSTLANMSTGSSHPLDFRRWAAFLVQVHREDSSLDVDMLAQWLIEELDWPPDKADKLAIEYEFARSLLRFYDSET